MTIRLKAMAMSLAMAGAVVLTMTEAWASDKEDHSQNPDLKPGPFFTMQQIQGHSLQSNLPFSGVDRKAGASPLENRMSKPVQQSMIIKGPQKDNKGDSDDNDGSAFVAPDLHKKVKTGDSSGTITAIKESGGTGTQNSLNTTGKASDQINNIGWIDGLLGGRMNLIPVNEDQGIFKGVQKDGTVLTIEVAQVGNKILRPRNVHNSSNVLVQFPKESNPNGHVWCWVNGTSETYDDIK